MELEQNAQQMTTERINAMADKAISMMQKSNDADMPYLLTKFDCAPEMDIKMVFDQVRVPRDILGTVIAKFKEKGWHVFYVSQKDVYEVHSRQLASTYYGHYV